jgi:glycopeptide antibiotics resistance protein
VWFFELADEILAKLNITGLGIAEFDDVFGNTMGGWIGILVAYIIMMWRSEMVSHHPQRHSNL